MIVWVASLFVQFTGQAFVTTYGAVFYRSIGIANPFQLTTAASGLTTMAVLIAMLQFQRFGRRNLLTLGSFLQATAIFVVGGMGLLESTQTNKVVIVSFVIIFGVSFAVD